MADDLIERLREITPDVCGKSYYWAKCVKEAADEIEALRKRVEELKQIGRNEFERAERAEAELAAAQIENERLRGIVPEFLEKTNDELANENDKLRAESEALRKRVKELEETERDLRRHIEKRASGVDPLAVYLREKAERAEALLRDERIRMGLHSLPLKLEFMKARGMSSLDEVDVWMRSVVERIDAFLNPTAMDEAIAAGDGTLHGAITYWQGRAERAEAELAAAREDAERYRWLRQFFVIEPMNAGTTDAYHELTFRSHDFDKATGVDFDHSDLDAAIDVARGKAPRQR